MSWHVCVSGSGVGQSAGLVVCDCMVPGSALSGILAFLLLCAGLPPFVIKKSLSPTLFNFILTYNSYYSVAIVPWLALGRGELPDSL